MKFLQLSPFVILIASFPFALSAQSSGSHPENKIPAATNAIKQELLRGPYLQVATSEGIVIRWRTRLPATSSVQYGSNPHNLDMQAVSDTAVTDHVVKVAGLRPSTKYYYAISSGGTKLQGDADNSFITLPPKGKEGFYRIGIFGDPGSLSPLQTRVRNQFFKYLGNAEMNAWMALGDIAYDQGLDPEYQAKFFNVYKDRLLKKYPLFPIPGNHDYRDNDSVAYLDQKDIEYFRTFSMPVNGESGGTPSHNPAYYSFDIGNIHILALDSFGEQDSTKLSDTSGPQVQWIKKDLEANENKDWVIAVWHHAPYSMGSHNSDDQDELVKIRENFIPLLERYHVDLVICGHSHLYERSKLMYGHYGKEATFNASEHDLSTSSGRYDGSRNSCPYIKDPVSNKGTVYLVNGGSSELGGVQKAFPHEAMYYSSATYGGTNMLEVRGNRLDVKWICEDGLIRDRFTMMKNVNKTSVVLLKKGQSATLSASYIGNYEWNNKKTTRTIQVSPPVGTTTFTVHDKYGCVKDSFKVIVSK